MSKPTVIPYFFDDDGQIPNNPDLPLLVYPCAMKDEPGRIEAVFNRSNWRNSWTNGVYGYHHYHSNSHEVLGMQSGSAAIQAGGEHGKTIELQAGDVIVLPAGTGHKLLQKSEGNGH